MSDRTHDRTTDDDALGRQIKSNLSGLDSFVGPTPPFAAIESPAPRQLGQRGKPGVRIRPNLKAAPGLLVAGLVVVIALGSGVWRPVHSNGATESATPSNFSSVESGTPEPSMDPSVAPPSPSGTNEATDPSPAPSVEPTGPTEPPDSSASASPSFGGVEATAESPWYPDEVYLLSLINCTRTGGWVSKTGACGTDSAHTLPAQPALVLDPGISAKVSRPYAKYLADRGILDHFAYHDPQWRLCTWGGLCRGMWGENLASPAATSADGMTAIEVFYQNESSITAMHYANIMNPGFHRVGIGVWKTGVTVRVVIDFYA